MIDTASENKTENKRIPIHGSFSRPGSPAEGVEEMIAGRVPWTRGNLRVTITTDEFTSLCPTTGLPDFNSITIEVVPDKFYLESKTVKYYFYSYREVGAHCESLAQMILDDVRQAIEPKEIKVTVNQSPRGGLRIVSEASWRADAATLAGLVPAQKPYRRGSGSLVLMVPKNTD